MRDEDAPLIEGCRRGDGRCHRALYAKYSGKVYGFARRFLGDDQHAEDVTQEVFLRVFRKLDGFRGDAKFSTWLYRVSLNSCKNKRRSLDRLARFDPDRFQRSRPEAAQSPERAALRKALQDHIDSALGTLGEEQQSLLLLKAVEELSYREIGEITGQSENQVRGKLYRARKAFRTALSEVSGGAYAEQEQEVAVS